jgi:signal transduction histidine kinase
MKKLLNKLIHNFLGAQLDLRVRLFNVLAIVGVINGFINGAIVLEGGSRLSADICLISGFAALAVLIFNALTKRYIISYVFTITFVFLGIFPALFFANSGYYSSVPYFFVFSVAFTIFMLDGALSLVVAVAELVVYIGLCVYAYYYPVSVAGGVPTEKTMLTSVIVGVAGASLSIGYALFQFNRMYREQQRKLDEQNEILAQVSRAKSEFLSNASHEMRTPLTVISVNVQTVSDILDELAVKDEEAAELLKNAQGEIIRLGRMVGGMLTLASMSESADRRKLDLSALIESGAETLRLSLSKHGNAIETEIEPGLAVFGNADLLAQVLANLLQNVNAHMENGTAEVSAMRHGTTITVTVRDSGTGIAPELLPRVFERGVSGGIPSGGGTGFGLYLCKTVIESHGGRIWIESEPGRGTSVSYTLPVYEGQLGSGE